MCGGRLCDCEHVLELEYVSEMLNLASTIFFDIEPRQLM